jgi:glycosyltransferase involved in cell wall biosynthesis
MSEPRPKVLLCVHSALAGGAQAMALAEAEHLAERFELLISMPRGPLRERFAQHGELVRATPWVPGWRASPARWALQSLRTGMDALRLAFLVRRRGVAAIVTSSTVLVAPVLAGRLARVPAVVHVREWPALRAHTFLFGVQGALADTVVAISAGLERRFAGSRARVVRIPDGIVVGPSAPPPPAFHQPLRLCVIGSVNANRGKGQDLAVAAVAQLRDRGVEATLEIVGPINDMAFAEHLERQAGELGLAGDVRVRGPVDGAAETLRAADLLLFCSRQGADVTPLVLMEAMAQCRPVVATRVGSVEEVVAHGETGLLVPPGDATAIANAVEELARNPDRARALAERGRSVCSARLDRAQGLRQLEGELRGRIAAYGATSEVPAAKDSVPGTSL